MDSNQVINGIIMNGARELRRENSNALGALQRANNTIDRCNNTIDIQNIDIINQRQEIINLRNELEAKKAEVTKFRVLAIQKLAHSEGLTAMLNVMKTNHPNSPALADSGKRYKGGNIKTKARILYEIAFDKIITAHGLDNPASYRAD